VLTHWPLLLNLDFPVQDSPFHQTLQYQRLGFANKLAYDLLLLLGGSADEQQSRATEYLASAKLNDWLLLERYKYAHNALSFIHSLTHSFTHSYRLLTLAASQWLLSVGHSSEFVVLVLSATSSRARYHLDPASLCVCHQQSCLRFAVTRGAPLRALQAAPIRNDAHSTHQAVQVPRPTCYPLAHLCDHTRCRSQQRAARHTPLVALLVVLTLASRLLVQHPPTC